MTARKEPRIDDELAVPRSEARRWWHRRRRAQRSERNGDDAFGRAAEWIARAMGTPGFLVGLTVFVALWIAWNSLAPENWRFDSAALGFITLTLMLSLQASYAAPMILLAQNRQDDRDRVQIEQDRQRAASNSADLEYLAREIVALRMHVSDMASKDFIRAELRSLLEELTDPQDEDGQGEEPRSRRAGDVDANRAEDLREERRRARRAESQTGAIATQPGPGTRGHASHD